MIEGRAIIRNIKETKTLIESLGGHFKSNYSFKDIIFVPKKENFNLDDDFVIVRVYFKNDWSTKNVIVVRKQTEFKKTGKIDRVIIKEEFDTEAEAFIFIKKSLPEFKKGFDYKREGWQYELNNHRIFIEDIEGFKPSIEIEATDEKDLQNFFNKIGILKQIRKSVPEIMRRLLGLNTN